MTLEVHLELRRVDKLVPSAPARSAGFVSVGPDGFVFKVSDRDPRPPVWLSIDRKKEIARLRLPRQLRDGKIRGRDVRSEHLGDGRISVEFLDDDDLAGWRRLVAPLTSRRLTDAAE